VSFVHTRWSVVLLVKPSTYAHVKHTRRLANQWDHCKWTNLRDVIISTLEVTRSASIGAISCVKLVPYILVIADSLIYSCSTNSRWNCMCICCKCQQRALYIWLFALFSEILRRISSVDTLLEVEGGIVHRVQDVTVCCVITPDAGYNTAWNRGFSYTCICEKGGGQLFGLI
jgi:hypothetical protein